ncbi:MAG: alpha/beta hydrolase [Clostridium butyricum]|nr:alpha/beta hydrolase [Clostridium butyricum]
MKLLSHSNGLHTVEKEKINKVKFIKRIIIFIVILFATGFIIEMVNKTIDDRKYKSRFKYVRVEGNKLEYQLKGSGEYTIVFDGNIGTNLHQWDNIYKTIEEESNVSVFRYNRSGYGFNDLKSAMTPEEQAKILKALLKKAGASGPYILVGEEYGSLIMTNFAKLYPDSVAGAILINPINESTLSDSDNNKIIRTKYYRSKIETIGANFSLTSLLSKMGLTMENPYFEENLDENEKEEFECFKNKKTYRGAISYELHNLYEKVSDSQSEGILKNKPLYIITDNADTSLVNMGDEGKTIVYEEKTLENSPYSMSNSDKVVTAINNVLKQAQKHSKN